MAPDLSRLELTVLLSELMGLYSIVPEADGGMIQRTVPLAVPEDFERLLAYIGSVNGASLLREALGDACVRSGSPRETKLSLRLGLFLIAWNWGRGSCGLRPNRKGCERG